MPDKKKSLIDKISTRAADAIMYNAQDSWAGTYKLGNKELTQANRVPSVADAMLRLQASKKNKKGY